MPADKPIHPAEFETIVANVPIVSVDLVVRHRGGIVLGKRRNEPARGEWFVPGGTVLKNERLEDAVHRVAREELGVGVTIRDRLGVYEHFYETSEFDDIESKHYLANAFVVEPNADELAPDDQHGELRVFTPPFSASEHHPYVERYLRDATV